MDKFKRHPIDVLKRNAKISRVHALEIARRAMDSTPEDLMPLTQEMPDMAQQSLTPQLPSDGWAAGIRGNGPPAPGLFNPMGGMMGGMDNGPFG